MNSDGKLSYDELLAWLWQTTDSLDFEKATISLQREPAIREGTYEVEVRLLSGKLVVRREIAEINRVKCIKNKTQFSEGLPPITMITHLINAAGEDIDTQYGEQSLAETFPKGRKVELSAVIQKRSQDAAAAPSLIRCMDLQPVAAASQKVHCRQSPSGKHNWLSTLSGFICAHCREFTASRMDS